MVQAHSRTGDSQDPRSAMKTRQGRRGGDGHPADIPTDGRRSGRINGRACVSCHHRKIRCDIVDKGAPCTNCSSHRRAGCSVYEKKRFREPRQSNPVTIRPRQSGGSSTPPPRSTSPAGHSDPGNLVDLVEREDLRTADIGLRGRLCFVGTGVSNFNYLVRQSSLLPGNDSIVHYGNRQFHLKHTAHDLHNVPPEALERTDRNLEQRLLRAYFDGVNRGWPIVDQDSFMAKYESKDPRNAPSLPLLNAMLVVGAHVLAFEDRSMKSLQPVFFRRAKMLVDRRIDQDRTIYIQVGLLLTWYSDGLEEIMANAWYWIGIASRTALGLGLHRDAAGSRMHPSSKRLWMRLWWLLVQFDTMMSATYGRIPALDLDESDVPELNASDFDGIPNAQVDFCIQHSKLCRIISRVTKKRWSLRATVDSQIEATREADVTLAEFTSQLPPGLHLSNPEVSPWKATLHLTYNNFLTLLHRPAPVNGALDPVSRACSDTSLCSGATSTTASVLDALRHRNLLSGLWLFDTQAVLTALIQVSGELRSTNPLVSVRAQQTFESVTASLKVLAHNWALAQGVLTLFEQRASKMRQGGVAAQQQPQIGSGIDVPARDGGPGDDPDFTLRPAPAQTSQTDPSKGRDAFWSEAPQEYGASTSHTSSWEEISALGYGDRALNGGKADDARQDSGDTIGVNQGYGEMLVPGLPFLDESGLEFFLADLGGGMQGAWL